MTRSVNTSIHFWLPFAKNGNHFAKADGSPLSTPFAGMGKPGKLRDAYEKRQRRSRIPV